MEIGWVILSDMGDICKICEQNGWLFTTHYFINSNCTDFLVAVWHLDSHSGTEGFFLDYWVLEKRFGSIREIEFYSELQERAFLSTNSILNRNYNSLIFDTLIQVYNYQWNQ